MEDPRMIARRLMGNLDLSPLEAAVLAQLETDIEKAIEEAYEEGLDGYGCDDCFELEG